MIENYELLRLSGALFVGIAMGILITRNTEKPKVDNSFNEKILEAINESKADLVETRIERNGFLQELDQFGGRMKIIESEYKKAKKEQERNEETKRKQTEATNSIEGKMGALRNNPK